MHLIFVQKISIKIRLDLKITHGHTAMIYHELRNFLEQHPIRLVAIEFV